MPVSPIKAHGAARVAQAERKLLSPLRRVVETDDVPTRDVAKGAKAADFHDDRALGEPAEREPSLERVIQQLGI